MNFNSMLYNIFAVPNQLFLRNRPYCRVIELEIKSCRLGSRIGDMEELSHIKQQQSHAAPARIVAGTYLSCSNLILPALGVLRLPSDSINAVDNQTNSCFFSTRRGVFGSLGSILFTPNSFCFMNITNASNKPRNTAKLAQA